ncbi:MAG: hypothetical protein M1133_05260 [Armatimonadetes bacterium]|nr:hypothetical protein [Armatimonadota bacterium]
MILTFEVDSEVRSLEIHFDEDGRDRLLALLSNCKVPTDHEHLFRFPEAGENSPISSGQYDEGSTTIGEVTLWLLPSDAEPVMRITE